VGIRLYVIPASHPCIAAELMLKHKGIDYKRRDLVMAAHKPIIRSLGFAGNTVPALKADGRKVQGSMAIARFLDEIKPEPALLPTDPEQRRAVEEAELWGDGDLQAPARRIALMGVAGDRSHLKEFLEGYKLGVPTGLAAATAALPIWAELKIHKAARETVRADVARIPELMDRVDQLIADGVIDGDQLNAADFEIAPSVRLLMALDQLRPLIDGRPAAAFAMRVVPDFHGRVPNGLPAEWVPSPVPAAPWSDRPS
jgi:glutathione S-transferase